MTLALLTADPVPRVCTPPAGRILGGAIVGKGPYAANAGSWPVQAVAAPRLGSTREQWQELWQTDADCESGEFAGIVFRRNAELLYGVLQLAEGDFVSRTDCPPLQAASEAAYRRIFALLDAQALPQLWRVWNYFADINRESDGLERYRQFNIGRHEAFQAYGRTAGGQVPAACAIGLRDGPLNIAFIAGRQLPLAIENPRQVSAYAYPPEYGPRSPTFSRAVLVTLPQQNILFLSGTASIVGHRTVHLNDVAGQCRETLDNIAAVVDEANRRGQTAFSMAELTYRAYLRHGNDFPALHAALAERLGDDASVVCLQADICRSDLLVEIEAMATHPVRSR